MKQKIIWEPEDITQGIFVFIKDNGISQKCAILKDLNTQKTDNFYVAYLSSGLLSGRYAPDQLAKYLSAVDAVPTTRC
jgi:hypothetical protein